MPSLSVRLVGCLRRYCSHRRIDRTRGLAVPVPYPEISYTDDRGRIVIKDIKKASIKDLVDFIKEEFDEDVTEDAVTKCRQRLAKTQIKGTASRP